MPLTLQFMQFLKTCDLYFLLDVFSFCKYILPLKNLLAYNNVNQPLFKGVLYKGYLSPDLIFRKNGTWAFKKSKPYAKIHCIG